MTGQSNISADNRSRKHRCGPAEIAAAAAELEIIFGDRLLSASAALAEYGQSEGHHAGHLPDLVVRPETIEEVQTAVRIAARFSVPIIAYGAGTSLEGNAAAIFGGLCIDMSLMNQITEIRPDDLLCVVGPGVTREQLNTDLRSTGLFFPIDPGANATLVGMVATRASGTTAVRYGTMRENTLALKVVLADGTLISTGTRARKSAAGYDLTHLFTGSEGTLGIIVEATLRLHGVPETIVAATVDFETLGGAVQAVIATMQIGIPIARIELLDVTAIKACNIFAQLSLPERPALFLEFHGTAASVAEQIDLFESFCSDFGGGHFRQAGQAEERSKLWKARHNALPAARAMIPGSVTWVTDVCVPLSHLSAAIDAVSREIEQAGLFAPILGHVGDGNFHVFFVLQEGDAPAWEAAAAINDRMVARALAAGGTCTGEHGIGMGKCDALEMEYGTEALAAMRSLKHAMDPANILNPGKILPTV